LAASFAIAGRDRGFSVKERASVLGVLVGQYRTSMRQFAAMSNLDVWYSHLDVETMLADLRRELSGAVLKRTEAGLAKFRTRDHLQAFDKLTRVTDGQRRIISDPPLVGTRR
jgi:hypothetical protein